MKSLELTENETTAMRNFLHGEDGEISGLRLIALQDIGEWRWGNEVLIVVVALRSEGVWGLVVQQSVGNHEGESSLDNLKTVTLRPVTWKPSMYYSIIKS